ENGPSAAIAISNASWRDPPTAQPTQFSSVRAASLRTGAGRSAGRAATRYRARVRVTSLGALCAEARRSPAPAAAHRKPRRLVVFILLYCDIGGCHETDGRTATAFTCRGRGRSAGSEAGVGRNVRSSPGSHRYLAARN